MNQSSESELDSQIKKPAEDVSKAGAVPTSITLEEIFEGAWVGFEHRYHKDCPESIYYTEAEQKLLGLMLSCLPNKNDYKKTVVISLEDFKETTDYDGDLKELVAIANHFIQVGHNAAIDTMKQNMRAKFK